jgi:class 3 adenylate cyclase
MEAYQEFLSEFLASKVALFGEMALRRARKVNGVVLDAHGRVVRIEGHPVTAVEGVLRTFEQLSGKASNLTARSTLRRLRTLERYPGLELPPSLT